MKRKPEFFGATPKKGYTETAVMTPTKLYQQERDWTCSIACLRSITSSIKNLGTEDHIIKTYGLCPGPYYSKDIKQLGILKDYIVEFGCDTEKNYDLDKLYRLLKNDYYVMVECMLNYDHWLVLMSYFPNNSKDIAEHRLLLYDPYFNEIKLMRAEEFCAMWISGEHMKNNVTLDYIAVKHTG